MELLYVWIKNYKNIKEQGFNFSPEWRFHYDPDSGDLGIEHIEQAIPQFFGPSISNVTAIVGENGSGKSNLMEFIVRLFDRGTGFWNEPFIVVNRLDDKLRIWYFKELLLNAPDEVNGIQIQKSNFYKREGKLEDGNLLRSINEMDEIVFIFYSQYFDGLRPPFGIFRHGNFLDISNSKLIVKKATGSSKTGEVLMSPIEYYHRNIRNQARLFANWGNQLLDFPIPHFLKITVNEDLKPEFLDAAFEGGSNFGAEEIWKFFDKDGIAFEMFRALIFSILFDVSSQSTQGIDRINEFKQRIQSYPEDKDPLHFLEADDDGLWGSAHKFIQWLISECKEYFQIFKNRDNALIIPTKSPLIQKFFDFLEQLDIKFSLPFDFAWTFEDDPNWEGGLSSGHNNIINFFSRIFIPREKFPKTESNTVIFFIDEGEGGLHPQLQKDYLNLLMKNIPLLLPPMSMGKTPEIQLILTSHSPFLLSDLPRENVIFLEKSENGNCKVSDGVTGMKLTFGANLHTLLSDSFFLKRHDGLMGTFAKKRIDQVIQFYQNNQPIEGMTEDESEIFAQKVANMIGEPIIKKYLLQLQFLRSQKNVQDDVKKLKEEIEELKKRLPDDKG